MDGGDGSNATVGDYIPEGLIADILSKLPSRSVLRFQSVCKSWYTLFSDPQFLDLHSKNPFQNPKILFCTAGSKLHLLDYDSPSFDSSCLSLSPKFPGEKFLNHAKIVGSTCGLVCVATNSWGNEFSIWNPLTGECRKIPKLSCEAANINKYYFHGLGYDSVANDFKLVVSMDRRITCNVFSLRENSWKTIVCPLAVKCYHPGPIPEPLYAILPWNSLAVVLNGVFYWLVVPDRCSDCEIVGFDVANEKFELLQLPVRAPWKSSVVSLFEHRGCLCVSFSKVESCRVREMWMMNECGDWVRLFTVKNSVAVDCFRLPVFCISTRDEVVYHTDIKFSRCGREEDDKLDEIRIQSCMYGAVSYVETLVSPNAEDGLHSHIKPMVHGNAEDGLHLHLKPMVHGNEGRRKRSFLDYILGDTPSVPKWI